MKYKESVEKDSEKLLNLKDICILYETFRKTVSKAFEENIPQQVAKKQHKESITDEIKNLSDKRRKAKGKTNYPDIDKEVKKKCNEVYAEYLDRKCDETEDSLVVNPAEAHRRIKDNSGKKRFSCKTCLIKDKNGTLLIENNHVKERWLQYTKEL